MSKKSDRAGADRLLYDTISGDLGRKDQLPAQRIARQYRLSQTFKNKKNHMG